MIPHDLPTVRMRVWLLAVLLLRPLNALRCPAESRPGAGRSAAGSSGLQSSA